MGKTVQAPPLPSFFSTEVERHHVAADILRLLFSTAPTDNFCTTYPELYYFFQVVVKGNNTQITVREQDAALIKQDVNLALTNISKQTGVSIAYLKEDFAGLIIALKKL